jgi:molybdopterin converting factor small subunit
LTSWASQIACAAGPLCHNRLDGGGAVKFLRMKPGHGEVLLAEGDVEVAAEEEALIEAFREQLEQGMWAAVPMTSRDGRREAQMVKAFDEVPRDADRVIFFPRAAGGR